MADVTGAADECEREVEQEVERDQQPEVESVLPQLKPTGETSWTCPRTALQLESATRVAKSQKVQVLYHPSSVRSFLS